MAKRSDKERKPRDWYPTPLKGAIPLLTVVDAECNDDTVLNFIEPFAGNGTLTDHLCLSKHFNCIYESDIEPQQSFRIQQHDYKVIDDELCNRTNADMFISNPPWVNTKQSGYQLFDIINHLSSLLPTWLLLDGGFAFNVGSKPYMQYCKYIIPVGRLKWIPDSKYTGTEDCAWFLFDKNNPNLDGMPYFIPREKWNSTYVQ